MKVLIMHKNVPCEGYIIKSLILRHFTAVAGQDVASFNYFI